MWLLTPIFALCAIHGQQPPAWPKQTFTGGVTASVPSLLEPFPPQESDPALSRSDFWQGAVGTCRFMVNTSEIKDPSKVSISTALSGVVTGLFQRPGMVIQGDKDLTLQGWPGLAVTGTDRGSIAVLRVYRCSGMVVTSVAIYPSKSSRPSEIDRFLDSLHLPSAGKTAVLGPEMSRYPLGDSGLTALFPDAPSSHDVPLGGGQQTLHAYMAEYGMRTFMVGYINMPNPLTDADLLKAKNMITDSFGPKLHAKLGETRDVTLGTEKGIFFDYTTDGKRKGAYIVFIHKSQIIYAMEQVPQSHDYSKTIESFLCSVEFKS